MIRGCIKLLVLYTLFLFFYFLMVFTVNLPALSSESSFCIISSAFTVAKQTLPSGSMREVGRIHSIKIHHFSGIWQQYGLLLWNINRKNQVFFTH